MFTHGITHTYMHDSNRPYCVCFEELNLFLQEDVDVKDYEAWVCRCKKATNLVGSGAANPFLLFYSCFAHPSRLESSDFLRFQAEARGWESNCEHLIPSGLLLGAM